MKKIKLYLQNKLQHHPTLIMIVALVLSIFFSMIHQDSAQSDFARSPERVDTYIPKGYVLIPIEIENKDSLTSMVEDYGIVDLYEKVRGQKPRLVGKSVKIIQAPKNPDVYAIMVPDREAASILQAQMPFRVIVQNPQVAQEKIYKPTPKKKPSRLKIYRSEKMEVL